MDDVIESHQSGILFYWELKKLQWCLYFAPPLIFKTGMVRSSFNIWYQSTGNGSLPSLSEIELRQSIWGVFLFNKGSFRWPFVKNILLEISGKTLRYYTCTSKINQIQQYGGFKLIQCLPMPMYEISIVRLFLYSR